MSIRLNHIYNENCLDTMSRMRDKSVDLVITSPPYNMNLRIRGGKYCSRQIVKELSTKYTNFDDNLPIDDFYSTHKSILSELLRVSKVVFYNIQIVTGSKRAFFKLIGTFNEYLKDIIVWNKVNSQPAMQAGVMNSQNELILVFGDNPISRQFSSANFDRGTLPNLWNIKKSRKLTSSHGAVFPEELVCQIINNFSTTGETCYDPFLGTGTTAVVCAKNGRNYIGSDISREYCDIAKNRLLESAKELV